MTTLLFNYSQDFTRRVINDPSLERYVWSYHNFGTSYEEPYPQTNIRNDSNQSYVFKRERKPLRFIELEYSTMIFNSEVQGVAPEMDYDLLQQFYLRHNCSKPFIYEHPVYGDMKVRFVKPISLPKKNQNGGGTLQGFSVTLLEMIDTDYIFHPSEDFSGFLEFPCGYYDVEIEYKGNDLAAPLGNNYTMIFKDPKPPIRTFKLSVNGLMYFTKRGKITLGFCPEQNMALLEAFYMQKRLNTVFDFEYAGEIIPVRFKTPLVIPKVIGNTGTINTLELTLVESPYKQYSESENAE